MAYEVVMPYHLHMPSYFLETFTEYPYLHRKKHTNNATLDKNKRYALTFEGISHPYLSP